MQNIEGHLKIGLDPRLLHAVFQAGVLAKAMIGIFYKISYQPTNLWDLTPAKN